MEQLLFCNSLPLGFWMIARLIRRLGYKEGLQKGLLLLGVLLFTAMQRVTHPPSESREAADVYTQVSKLYRSGQTWLGYKDLCALSFGDIWVKAETRNKSLTLFEISGKTPIPSGLSE